MESLLPQTFSILDSHFIINGLELTDLAGPISAKPVSGDGRWNVTEGPRGTVSRGRNVNTLWEIDLSLTQGSAQLDLLESLGIADESAGAGPYAVTFTHTGSTFSLVGLGWIQDMDTRSVDKAPGPVAVKIYVKVSAKFAGHI